MYCINLTQCFRFSLPLDDQIRFHFECTRILEWVDLTRRSTLVIEQGFDG